MTLQQIPGGGLWMPGMPLTTTAIPALNTGSAAQIDATGEMLAYCGRVWFPSRTGTKDIRRIGFLFGNAVTKAGGSALTVSLQDVVLSSGPPMQPDGTQDQTVAIANANASFAANTWFRSGTLSADRTVTYGDLLSVVIEFDGAGRLGADAIRFTGLNFIDNGFGQCVTLLKTSGTWAASAIIPNVILEFSDGTFGTLDGSWPLSLVNTHTFNSGSAADEIALEFSVPFKAKLDGGWGFVSIAGSTSDFDIVLYDGTTALATYSVDANAYLAAGAARISFLFTEQTLTPGSTYRLAFKPTTANNISIYSFDVSDANHLTCHPGGTAFKYTTRVDAGSWAAATATRRLFAGIRVSSLDDGVGGGGVMINPGLAGGLR